MTREVPKLPFGLDLPSEPPRRVFNALLEEDHLNALVGPDEEGAHTVEMGIPMRDGLELAADVYFPAESKLPAPAVVVGSPYDKSAPFSDVTYLPTTFVAEANPRETGIHSRRGTEKTGTMWSSGSQSRIGAPATWVLPGSATWDGSCGRRWRSGR